MTEGFIKCIFFINIFIPKSLNIVVKVVMVLGINFVINYGLELFVKLMLTWVDT
jgi:magnesium-transporting ATPase (P-type)